MEGKFQSNEGPYKNAEQLIWNNDEEADMGSYGEGSSVEMSTTGAPSSTGPCYWDLTTFGRR